MSSLRFPGLLLLAGALGASLAAPPPPRDSGPARFVAPPPRKPLYPAPAPASIESLREEEASAPATPPPYEPTAKATQPATTAPANDPAPKPEPARQAQPAATRPARTQAAPSGTAPSGTAPTTATTAPGARKVAPDRVIAAKPEASSTSAVASGEADASAFETAAGAFIVSDFDVLPDKRGLAANHYPASNENRIDLFRRYVEDLGGGYLGVGTDQNLTFVAWARSSHVWLMDFDPVSVGINKIHVFFLKRARTYDDFRRLWQAGHRKTSRALIAEHFKDDPYRAHILRSFTVAHAGWAPVPARLRELESFSKRFGLRSFHNDPADYLYLRNLALAGRIQALPGDLRGPTSMRAVHRAALALGVPIRLVYTSNAEDYFPYFPGGFRANMIDVPGDARSVILRTISQKNYIYGQPPGEKFPRKAPFHYNVQTLDSFKSWLQYPRTKTMHTIMPVRKQIQQGLSLIHTSPARKQAGQTGDTKPR